MGPVEQYRFAGWPWGGCSLDLEGAGRGGGEESVRLLRQGMGPLFCVLHCCTRFKC